MLRLDLPPCDQCGSGLVQTLFHNHDYISGESFGIVACVNCDLVRTDYTQGEAALSRYYGPSYYGSAEGRRFIPVMEWLIRRFREQRLRAVLKAYGKAEPGRILDLGTGRGLMLQALRQRGWECQGTELSEALAQRLASEGIQIHTQPDLKASALEDNYFDIVTSWHSLEHMSAPAQTLSEIARILKPGGKLILEVPNLASWQAGIGQGRWFHLDAPRHLYHFTPDQLHQMLADRGLHISATHSLSLEYGFYGMYQSMLNRLTTENNVLYNLLKRQIPLQRGPALVWNIAISLLALPLIGLAGTILELLASRTGSGGIIALVAEKTDDKPTG